MRGWVRLFLIINLASLLLACNQNPEIATGNTERPAQVKHPGRTATTGPDNSQTGNQDDIVVTLRPAQPSSSDCIRAVVQGSSGGAAYQWIINGKPVPNHSDSKLCSESFKRDDQVMVQVGRGDSEASDIVIIGNTPPRILEVSATSDQVHQHGPITVSAIADDVDGDEVEFRYQWVINGEDDPFSMEATLPAENYAQGDTIKVRIVPFDGIDAGNAYESAELKVDNAPPRITSRPPMNFETREYLYQVEATDPDGHDLVYRLEKAPGDMTISETGLISWNLTGVSAGAYIISIAVEDSEGAKTNQGFTLNLGERQ